MDLSEDLLLNLVVQEGPVTEAQDQISLDLVSSDDAPVPISINLWTGRVDNNVTSVALVYVGRSTDLELDALAARAYEKLAAVTAGEPVPPSKAAAAAAARQLQFGATYTSDHTGNRMTVSPPQAFQPSETASAESGRGVLLEVKVENASSEPLEAYNFSFSATCDGVAAPMVYDSEQGLTGGTPPGDILPGRASTWRMGFTVPQPDLCELIVTMDYGLGDSVYWIGPA